MEKKDKCFIIRSNTLRQQILYPIVLIGLLFAFYTIEFYILPSVVILLLFGTVSYKFILTDDNNFYFYSNKIIIHNKFRFWSKNETFYYNNIKKIVIKNLSAAYYGYIRFYLYNNKKRTFGFFSVNKNRLKKIIKKFEEGGFDIEYHE